MLPALLLLCRPWAGSPTASAPTLRYRVVSTLHIVLLNHLFRWPVPAELCRGKAERIEKGGKATLDLGKGFIQRKLFAQMGLALEPHVFDRILFWRIGGKAHAGDFPVGLGQAGILLCEKLLPLLSAMVTGPIPEKQQLLGGIQRLASLKIRD